MIITSTAMISATPPPISVAASEGEGQHATSDLRSSIPLQHMAIAQQLMRSQLAALHQQQSSQQQQPYQPFTSTAMVASVPPPETMSIPSAQPASSSWQQAGTACGEPKPAAGHGPAVKAEAFACGPLKGEEQHGQRPANPEGSGAETLRPSLLYDSSAAAAASGGGRPSLAQLLLLQQQPAGQQAMLQQMAQRLQASPSVGSPGPEAAAGGANGPASALHGDRQAAAAEKQVCEARPLQKGGPSTELKHPGPQSDGAAAAARLESHDDEVLSSSGLQRALAAMIAQGGHEAVHHLLTLGMGTLMAAAALRQQGLGGGSLGTLAAARAHVAALPSTQAALGSLLMAQQQQRRQHAGSFVAQQPEERTAARGSPDAWLQGGSPLASAGAHQLGGGLWTVGAPGMPTPTGSMADLMSMLGSGAALEQQDCLLVGSPSPLSSASGGGSRGGLLHLGGGGADNAVLPQGEDLHLIAPQPDGGDWHRVESLASLGMLFDP